MSANLQNVRLANLPPIGLAVPSSWYCLGLSRDLAAGQVWRRTLAGQELVVFRTATGQLASLGAYCPHLGADLGVGGKVEGETIRCPFHGFCFGADGSCTSTPYGKRVPPAAKAKTIVVQEKHGLVFGWHGAAGEPPSFDIDDVGMDNWTDWREHVFELRGHPQEIAENSVDFGHFGEIHGYQDVKELAPLRTEGPLLLARYSFLRPRVFAGMDQIGAEIAIHQQGLGYARVDVEIAKIGLRTRQMVLTLPLGGDRIQLRILMAIHRGLEPGKIHPLIGWLPRGWLAERIATQGIVGYREDVAQDLPIWEAKVHLTRPALAEGDGPIGAYRKWTKQFYPQAVSEATSLPVAAQATA
jgi:nitrite reductase/ring-hydroxylating ferredoxin subunit